jgi:methyl-accepting chemotaxis protein
LQPCTFFEFRPLFKPRCKFIYRKFVEAAKGKTEGGFVEYRQVKPKEGRPLPKISYVKHFEPRDWIVGTGIDVDEMVDRNHPLERIPNRS